MRAAIRHHTARITILGSLVLAIILIAGTIWMGQSANRDTQDAVRTVSLLYLDELAGRREQVVEDNLNDKVQTIRVAIELLTEDDLSEKSHLEAYQARMKRLYTLDKFAFVDTDGLIYTSLGTETNIDEYAFDYRTLSGPEISIFDPDGGSRHVIIAVPVSIPFQGKTLTVCFMAMDMEEMLSGVSMTTNTQGATFCNLYQRRGAALTNAVLGGLAEEDNLLDAMRIAAFEQPYSYESFSRSFQSGERGVVSFDYNGVRETLTYIPVSGTDWQLTYLIRESVISSRISAISKGTVTRSIIQSLLTVAVMALMFVFIISQNRKNNSLLLEKETADAEMRGKQEELERRIALQGQLEEQSQALSDALHAAEDASRAKTAFLSKPLFAAAVLEEFKSALKKKGQAVRRGQVRAELEGRHILLAEDVPVNAEIIIMLLQMRQIEVDHAENGRLAVDMFSSHPVGYYDAILMDMRMPEMDGLEATRTIRAMDREDAGEIPIIALTANAFDEDVQRSLQAGLNAHLTKPVQPEALFETLESLIRP